MSEWEVLAKYKCSAIRCLSEDLVCVFTGGAYLAYYKSTLDLHSVYYDGSAYSGFLDWEPITLFKVERKLDGLNYEFGDVL